VWYGEAAVRYSRRRRKGTISLKKRRKYKRKKKREKRREKCRVKSEKRKEKREKREEGVIGQQYSLSLVL
jgi:hypothetical protein